MRCCVWLVLRESLRVVRRLRELVTHAGWRVCCFPSESKFRWIVVGPAPAQSRYIPRYLSVHLRYNLQVYSGQTRELQRSLASWTRGFSLLRAHIASRNYAKPSSMIAATQNDELGMQILILCRSSDLTPTSSSAYGHE